MKSFFLVIELSGLPQLLSLDEPAATDFLGDSERIINNIIKSDMLIRGSLIIFKIEAELNASRAIIESGIKILEKLNERKQDFLEYSMLLLCGDSKNAEKIINGLKNDYHVHCIDSALRIEKQIFDASGLIESDEVINGFHVFYSDDEGKTDEEPMLAEEKADSAEANKILELIVPEIGCPRETEAVVLRGGSDAIMYNTIEAALRKLKIPVDYCPLIISCMRDESDITKPFYRSIDEGFLGKTGGMLHGVEAACWEERAENIISVNSDHPEESFFLAYSLYLKARLSYFKERMLPVLIVIEGIENASSSFMEYLSKLLDFVSEAEPVIIYLENNDHPVKDEIRNHRVLQAARIVECCNPANISAEDLNLKYILKRLLFTVELTEGVLDSGLLYDFLTGFGYEPADISSGLSLLEEKGLIRNGRYPHLLRSRACEECIRGITNRSDIYNALALFVKEHLYQIRRFDFGLAAERLMPHMSDCETSEAVYSCLGRLLDYGFTEKTRRYLRMCMNMPQNYHTALSLRTALLEGRRDKCIELIKKTSDKPETPENYQDAAVLLESSRYFHALKDYQRALDYIKKVIIFLQNEDAARLEGIAFIELGFIMLCKGKLLESSEYLMLAVEKLNNSGDDYSLLKAYIFSAIGQYLWGSLDNSLEFTEKAIEKARLGGYENWYYYTEFFKCRLLFELGRYLDAEKLLAGCLLRNELFADDKRKKLLLAWTARACVYQGKVYRGLNMLKSLEEDPEVLLFLAEAYSFRGNLDKAVDKIEQAGGMSDYFIMDFIPLEKISWDNGFISVEDRVLRSSEGTGVLFHIIRAFQAYFLGLSGNKEYGIELLFSLTRDQKISENDPFNRLYFYFYCILYDKKNNTDIVDKLTLISKALKYLQQISSRINTPRIRQEFMNKNYWNTRLLKEARNEKLI